MSRPERLLASLALLAWLCAAAIAHADSVCPLWAGLLPGHYTVGYQRIDDTTTVHVWYPAERKGSALTFGDYLGSDRDPTAAFLAKNGVDSTTIQRLLTTRLHGSANAKAET